MIKNPTAKLKNLPNKPGVYIFKDASAKVLYVGKAKSLKNRVSQYFRKNNDGRAQIPFLMSEAEDFEFIVTANEIESLFLENNLIKQYRPKYNIKLRDDKNYVFIKIDFDQEIPGIYTIRNPDSKNAKYFGPYSSAQKVRETLNLLRKIFPYCANQKVSNRPCFYYYLHRCPGVCIGKISLEEYKTGTIKKIASFLAGNIAETKKEIKSQMRAAAKHKMFELAANLRDQLRALEITEQRQNVIFAAKVNWDFISYFQTIDKTVANVFTIRSGRMLDKKDFILEDTANQNGAKIIGAFIQKYYAEAAEKPKQLFVQELPEELELFKKLLAGIKISKPSRGKKLQLIKLGIKNAQQFFESWALAQASEISRTTLALEELAKVLKIEKPIQRIECFDISNIQGTNSVASMVVFENGKAKKSEYRKFKIRQDGKPNDFAMMYEALSRRFSIAHLDSSADNTGSDYKKWPLPDLLVIDGGKGQLGVAAKILKERDLEIPVIGLAKREEEIFTPGKAMPILLPKSNYSLQLLQRVRDEAHRFAITFHKKLRSKQSIRSRLDEIPGIGPKTKKLLLQHFGSVQKIKEAGETAVAEVVGAAIAKKISTKI